MVAGSDEDAVDVLVDEVVVGSILVGTVVPKEMLAGRRHAPLESLIALAKVRVLPAEGDQLRLRGGHGGSVARRRGLALLALPSLIGDAGGRAVGEADLHGHTTNTVPAGASVASGVDGRTTTDSGRGGRTTGIAGAVGEEAEANLDSGECGALDVGFGKDLLQRIVRESAKKAVDIGFHIGGIIQLIFHATTARDLGTDLVGEGPAGGSDGVGEELLQELDREAGEAAL